MGDDAMAASEEHVDVAHDRVACADTIRTGATGANT